MTRILSSAVAATLFLAAVAAPSPARAADVWWFVAGAVFSMVTAPAYSYPYGYRSGYAPAAPMAPWAAGPMPGPQECHWAKVQQNGVWRHARVCYEAGAVAGPQPQFSDTIISK